MAQRIKLRRQEVEDRANALGLLSLTEQARALDCHHSIHHRALAGQRQLNGPYVLSILWVFGSEAVRGEIKALFEFDETPVLTNGAA